MGPHRLPALGMRAVDGKQEIYLEWPNSLNTDGIFLETSTEGVKIQKRHSNLTLIGWLLRLFTYRNGIQNFLGDTFSGTVYPEDISCGGTQYPRILCTGMQKNQGCQISYDTGESDRRATYVLLSVQSLAM